jgi:hypothetical protein
MVWKWRPRQEQNSNRLGGYAAGVEISLSIRHGRARPAISAMFDEMAGSRPRLSGSSLSEYSDCVAWRLYLVLAVLGAAIHVFADPNKDVGGRDEPGHDVGKASVPDSKLNRTAVGQARP